jgi:hypothetical protein
MTGYPLWAARVGNPLMASAFYKLDVIIFETIGCRRRQRGGWAGSGPD